ncbi:hypothetical protein [Kitasatospora sp. A2-31]|uniref:hypothetical protein n=1 Tax=Kitasatospora sp. A2-31 TaxID=2916414 RepID=UPI001EEB8156|nr:hypothetical protein [Kitasatospora sp. A2-31]MCG6498271.1 hypothetical protein [Kitasatospora sp. A2-31]
MRGNRVVRLALGLSAALMAAACGSSGAGDGKAAADGPAAPTAAAPATAPVPGSPAPAGAQPPAPARVLDAVQLQAAVLATGDLPGYTATGWPVETGRSEPLPTTPQDCQPVENIRTGKIRPAASAKAAGSVMSADAGGAGVGILLGGFEGDGAKQVLAALRTALKSCTHYEGGVPRPATVAALPAPALGDEAVSYTLAYGANTQEVTVVRQGAVVAVFAPGNLSGGGKGGPATKVPQEVVARQLEKLRKAAG